jgi:competence protein ComEA
MKKLVSIALLFGGFLFASINLQTASKEELMEIKGIGEKKAEQIIEYRKTNKINSPEDLKNVKGIGDSIVNNVKNNVSATTEKKEEKVVKKEEKKN